MYSQETQGVRITVQPRFLAEQSEPEAGRWVFVYFIRIENHSQRTLQLLTRRWHIHDDNGPAHDVMGDGVVGQQPTLTPGASHEYHSFCVLASPSGYMEGSYHFASASGGVVSIPVPRFLLKIDD